MKVSKEQGKTFQDIVGRVKDGLHGTGFAFQSMRLRPLDDGRTHLCIGPQGQHEERDEDEACPPGWEDSNN